ncbi:hypothetical protein RI129_006041 [Pyrocoelia pectoralis]|uniref:CRAL-TRIO domain-containing protein n=1 Tax=Pyrocoelia pectoralis TaxID=417401 RepID=A0AAN7VFS2_9COLE
MEIRSLRSDLQEKAIKELNEDPKRIPEMFKHIMEWLRKQPHLNISKDDQLMIAFFRGCKWSLQNVKAKLDYFYSIQGLIPEFFENRDPFSPEIQNVLKARVIFPFPKVEKYVGPVIVMYNLKNIDGIASPLTVTMKLFFMTLDILMKEDDDFVISGVTILADHDQCPSSYYLQFNPTAIKNYITCLQHAYPIRVKNFIALNALTAFETIFDVCAKPFLSMKLRERIFVFNTANSKKFLSQFPQFLLPREYGGTNGTMADAADEWARKVENYREWFLEDAKYGCNETLRIGKIQPFDNGVGVDGTFRKLDID